MKFSIREVILATASRPLVGIIPVIEAQYTSITEPQITGISTMCGCLVARIGPARSPVSVSQVSAARGHLLPPIGNELRAALEDLDAVMNAPGAPELVEPEMGANVFSRPQT